MQSNLDLTKAKQLINKSKIILAYVLLSTEEGQYVRVYKNDLLMMLENGADFDLDKFNLHEDGNLYIN
tara:strand:- start:1255 stop:1458 length:204 start_codon:yes stop_codon:yes gene_type:complete